MFYLFKFTQIELIFRERYKVDPKILAKTKNYYNIKNHYLTAASMMECVVPL